MVDGTVTHVTGFGLLVDVVTAIDPEKERISLSIKQLAGDPWTRVGTDFVDGGVYDAEITRLMPFGVFARIGDGLEGLIHVTELAAHRGAEAGNAVQVGTAVRVKVVAIDPERRRLSLSIRQADGRSSRSPNV